MIDHMDMKVYDSTSFVLPLPDTHRFPMDKYRLLSERVKLELPEVEVLVAPAISRTAVEYVHDKKYVADVFDGRLDAQAQRRIGFPWSKGLVERSRRSVGATVAASHAALTDGVSVNLAGGTHHAHHDFGSGFCVFNDVAIAIDQMKRIGVKQFAVVDCDVHQGDGTAKLHENDDQVLTVSLHGAENFPFRKMNSSIDIALPRGVTDQPYLSALRKALDRVDSFAPDMIFYVAGADPFAGDKLGHLRLSKDGLSVRDQLVIDGARQRQIPLAITMGGGYAEDISDIVDIHFNTVRLALLSASAFNGTL